MSGAPGSGCASRGPSHTPICKVLGTLGSSVRLAECRWERKGAVAERLSSLRSAVREGDRLMGGDERREPLNHRANGLKLIRARLPSLQLIYRRIKRLSLSTQLFPSLSVSMSHLARKHKLVGWLPGWGSCRPSPPPLQAPSTEAEAEGTASFPGLGPRPACPSAPQPQQE